MIDIQLSHIPAREERPREKGVTMVMDKGLSLREAENFIEAAGHLTDLVKLGFGTSFVSKNVKEKVALYKKAGIKCYLGGTFMEAFVIRNDFQGYLKLIDKLGVDTAEVSDGSIEINHDVKCQLIEYLAKNYTVLSEVGSKEEGIIIHPNKWITMMNKELQAGAWKVIAEAREGGNVGIYHRDGKTHGLLVDKILSKVPQEKIMWEAPQKSQQIYFIKLLGANVNLGNIAPNEAIPLETLRVGLRGDTFFTFLPSEFKREIAKIDFQKIK